MLREVGSLNLVIFKKKQIMKVSDPSFVVFAKLTFICVSCVFNEQEYTYSYFLQPTTEQLSRKFLIMDH